jgi:hypothetical protein
MKGVVKSRENANCILLTHKLKKKIIFLRGYFLRPRYIPNYFHTFAMEFNVLHLHKPTTLWV